MAWFRCLENSSCTNRQLRYLVGIRRDRNQQLMLSGIILVIICIALYVNLTIMLSKSSSNDIQDPLKNGTNETTNYSTNLPYIVTSEKSITSSAQTTLSTTVVNQTEEYTDHPVSEPLEYETFGHPLDNSLYYNYIQLSHGDGYVNSISLRLFNQWKGNASLYIFIIPSYSENTISYRYAINPLRNTTEWQTIKIPSHALTVSLGYLLAIGMQESSGSGTNQIYAVKSSTGISAININENTTVFMTISDHTTGVAFSYTAIYNRRTTAMKPLDAH